MRDKVSVLRDGVDDLYSSLVDPTELGQSAKVKHEEDIAKQLEW